MLALFSILLVFALLIMTLRCRHMKEVVTRLSTELFKIKQANFYKTMRDSVVTSLREENNHLLHRLHVEREFTKGWIKAWKEDCKELPAELLNCLKARDDENEQY